MLLSKRAGRRIMEINPIKRYPVILLVCDGMQVWNSDGGTKKIDL